MPSKRIKDLIPGSAAAGHFVPVDDPAGITYRVPLGQAGGLPFLDASGGIAAADAHLFRGDIDFLGTDWNTITATGTYRTRDAGTGGANYPPAGYRWGILVVSGDGSTHIVQTYFPHVNDAYIYYRVSYPPYPIWSEWKTAGSVAGSNASGSYVRLADGTQICWAKFSFTANAGARTDDIQRFWPAAFANSPVATLGYSPSGPRIIPAFRVLESTTYAISAYNFEISSATLWFYVVATGRWK